MTLRDCEILQFIIAPSQPDTFEISGLINDTYYSDWTAPFPDRTLKLINTEVKCWSIQIFAPIKLTIKNSIFGELNCYDDANVTVKNCIHDGSCGPNNTTANSFFFIENSNFNTTIMVEGNGFSAFYYSIIWKSINVNGNFGKPILVLLNTEYFDSPLILDSATVFCASIDKPGQAGINDSVKIDGSAWIDGGLRSPREFDSYKLSYAYYSDSLGPWQPITNWVNKEVRDSVLGIWSTYGLEPGYYGLQLWIKDNMDDSVHTEKSVILLETGIEEVVSLVTPKLWIEPNPFCASTSVRYYIQKESRVKVNVLNLAGQSVKVLVNRKQKTGSYTVNWNGEIDNGKIMPSGIYFIKLKVGDDFSRTKKLLLLR